MDKESWTPRQEVHSRSTSWIQTRNARFSVAVDSSGTPWKRENGGIVLSRMPPSCRMEEYDAKPRVHFAKLLIGA